jgi:glycosyltransferase involved in cell wall biosynthesis
MIVLTVHNSYKELGGEDIVFDQESRALTDAGHTVYRYHENNSAITPLARVATGMSAVWSQRSYRRIAARIRETRCDVVHCHNTFPLISPAAYYAARAAGVPVVQTLHNYRLLCPNALLFRAGKICEDCIPSAIPWLGVARGCYRHSRLSSGSVAAMLTVHRLLRTWDRMVDLYIAPSRFCRDKYVAAGFDPRRIAVKPGFVYPDPGEGTHCGNYCLFVGRLSEEKGLDVLLRACRALGPTYPLKIIGDGPLASTVVSAAREMPWVEWLGYREPAEVRRWMADAKALVFPCQAYATFGLVVIEAFAAGVPAIVPRIGALAELVQDGRNGLHFDSYSADSLAATVRAALSPAGALDEMGRAARSDFLRTYTADANTEELLRLYRRVTAGRHSAAPEEPLKAAQLH